MLRRLAAAALLLALAPAAARGGERVTLAPPGDQGRPELVRLGAELDRAAAAMAAKLPPGPRAAEPVKVVVEPDHVAQALHAGNVGEAVPDPQGDLHLVWDGRDVGAYRYALARVLLERSGAAAKAPGWLGRGAALTLAGDWYGRPWREWLPLFAAARALPSTEELLAAEDGPQASVPLFVPAAAAVVEALPGSTLAEKLARRPSREEVQAVLDRLAAAAPPRAALSVSTAPPALPPFLAGVSLAMRNSLEGGYHAPALDRQLDALAALGANAVSIMPFAFQPAADRPELAYLNRGPRSETDLGLIHAARRARERGLHVLWKPHVWVGRGSWAGEVAMANEGDWAAWWRGYRRYVLHHAFLARWAGADLFSVGCELSKTVGREREWRDLIAAVRALYPGTVTYAGNWYGDLEGVRFWDALDVVGIDSYYPLSASPRATQAELEAGARQVAGRFARAAKRLGKRVLLTEVGFAAHRGAWMAPHTEGGEASQEDQARAYRALFAAFGRRPWLAGTFVWKAFSAPDARGGEADFRFQGRQAEGAIRDYYRRDR